MRLKQTIITMLILFCAVTTAQVLFIGIFNLSINSEETLTFRSILRMPLIAFASVLPMLVFVRGKTEKPQTRKESIFRQALHFVLTAGIVIGLMIYFEWINTGNAIILILFFLTVYIAAYTIIVLRDRRLARQINERINAFRIAENETHTV